MDKLPHDERLPVRRGMFLLLLAGVTLLFFGLISSFLMACFWAAIFAILFHGVYVAYRRMLKGRRDLASLLTCLTVVLTVALPIGAVTLAVINQSKALFQKLEEESVSFKDIEQSVESQIPVIEETLVSLGLNAKNVREQVRSFLRKALGAIGERTWHYTQGFLGFLVEFFLMLYLLFFWIRDGEKIIEVIQDTVPMGDAIEKKLFRKFAQVARATLKGTVIVAACQGLIGGLLFAFLKIEGAVLWGVLMGLLSLLPVGGNGLVWVPAAIIMYIQGHVTDAIIIVVVGALGIGLIDNLLRPILVGRQTSMPDYLVLLATLGGLAWVGLSGFILGPAVAALFLTCWQISGELFGGKDPAGEGSTL